MLDQIGLHKLLAREIHTHCQRSRRRKLLLPEVHLLARRAQDPGPDRHNQACLLGRRDELEWGDEPALGVLPTHQGLEPHELAAVQVHQGLVEDDKFLAFHGPSQINFHLQERHSTGIHVGVEDLIARLAVGFGTIHGGFGIAYDLLRPIIACGAQGDTNTGRGEHLMSTNAERGRELLLQALSDTRGVADIFNAVQQNAELIAAQARHRGCATQTRHGV